MSCPGPVAPSKGPRLVLECTVCPELGEPPSVAVAVRVILVSPSPGTGFGVATRLMAGVVEQAAQKKSPRRRRIVEQDSTPAAGVAPSDGYPKAPRLTLLSHGSG